MASGPETAGAGPGPSGPSGPAANSAGRPAGRVVAAVILTVLAVVLIIIGAVYLAEPSRSLPSFMPGHLAGSTRHHPLRTAGCFVLGLMFLAGAWVALTFRPKAAAPAGRQVAGRA
jgi:preprotein translocase subunit SecY